MSAPKRRSDPVLRAQMLMCANFLDRVNNTLSRDIEAKDRESLARNINELISDGKTTLERMMLLKEGADLEKLKEAPWKT